MDRAIGKIQDTRERELRLFNSAVDGAVRQARARVADSVGTSIDRQLEPALRAYVATAPQTVSIVQEVTTDLERRVNAAAAGVVMRLAREEVASRALSDSIEARLQAQIDKRIGTFWGGCMLGVGLGGIGGLLLSRYGASRRER